MPVSVRTVQLDIQMMRSDKLGYEAPIVVVDRKYYTYEDPDYTITDVPLSSLDMDILGESVAVLKQFKDFGLFRELTGVIQKLEEKVRSSQAGGRSIIHLDTNDQLKGLEHLDGLYQAIQKEIVLDVTYQSFTATAPQVVTIHGYWLKEFNNRWFLVGERHKRARGREVVLTLALDRMQKVVPNLREEYRPTSLNPDDYYQHTYGVSVLRPEDVVEVELWVAHHEAPYVLTKPLHQSQRVLEEYPNGSVRVSLMVHHNYELERLLMGFAGSMEVIAPESLRERMHARLQRGAEMHSG